jgi:hypothetical protein
MSRNSASRSQMGCIDRIRRPSSTSGTNQSAPPSIGASASSPIVQNASLRPAPGI